VNRRFPRQFAALGIFGCFFLPLLGPGPSVTAESQNSAKSLARLVEEHYRRPRTLKAVFLERYSEGQREARVESGTVYFRRPGQMRWEYESPERKLFLVDGKNTWFYVPYDHTVTKAPVKESSDWRTPLALLTGKADLERLCSQIDEVKQSGVPQDHTVLRCVPKGSTQDGHETESRSRQKEQSVLEGGDYTEVLLEVDSSTGELERINVRQPGSVELEYRFGDWQTDIPLSSDLFRFQVPLGVAIVDAEGLASSRH
jgi:outer membrane lipoprotein carrier protein